MSLLFNSQPRPVRRRTGCRISSIRPLFFVSAAVNRTDGLYLFGIPCPPCAKHRIEALHPLAGGSRDIERHLFFPQNRQCLYCNQFGNVRLFQNQSALLDNRIGFRYNDIYYFVHSQRLQRIQRWRLIAAATVGSHSVFGKISCGLKQP